MKRQRFIFAGAIVLIIVGLIKSVHYEIIIGTHGSGFEFGFDPSLVLLFGLMGLGLSFADRRKVRE